MSFDIDKCIIKQVWCGEGSYDKKKYTRKGSAKECIKKGFGSGMYNEKRKHLPDGSLRHIQYVGEVMEAKFNLYDIYNIDDLIAVMKKKSQKVKHNLLKSVLQNKDGTLNKKAYNSVIAFLYYRGVLKLPECQEL